MKKSVVGIVALNALLTGVSADFGDPIYDNNIFNKKNKEVCKQYYHKNKIKFLGSNDIPDLYRLLVDPEYYGLSSTNEKVKSWLKVYDNAIAELSKKNFDISKYSEKSLVNHAICKLILDEQVQALHLYNVMSRLIYSLYLTS